MTTADGGGCGGSRRRRRREMVFLACGTRFFGGRCWQLQYVWLFCRETLRNVDLCSLVHTATKRSIARRDRMNFAPGLGPKATSIIQLEMPAW